jgi:hypothetical protein
MVTNNLIQNEEFMKELTRSINKHNIDNELNTPDFILAEYVFSCLTVLQNQIRAKENWFGAYIRPGCVEINSSETKVIRPPRKSEIPVVTLPKPLRDNIETFEISEEEKEKINNTF